MLKLNDMLNKIKVFIFGERAQGEPLPQPKFKTTNPSESLPEFDWYRALAVSSSFKRG